MFNKAFVKSCEHVHEYSCGPGGSSRVFRTVKVKRLSLQLDLSALQSLMNSWRGRRKHLRVPTKVLHNVTRLSYFRTLFHRFLALKYENNRYLIPNTTLIGYCYNKCCYDCLRGFELIYAMFRVRHWSRWSCCDPWQLLSLCCTVEPPNDHP